MVNFVDGTNDADDLQTGGEIDFIVAKGGNDTVLAGGGDDTIRAGGGDDNINAGAGNDRINAGAGDDAIAGGLGDDRIAGGLGNDTINGGEGNNIMSGGDGEDVFVFSTAKSTGNDKINDFEVGVDEIRLNDLTALEATQVGSKVVVELDNGGTITLANTVLDQDIMDVFGL